jgi:hypothetical protein
MRCPYCVTEIADAAVVCPQCARDLYLFKPLLERIGQLEAQVAEAAKAADAHKQRVAALEQELDARRALPPEAKEAGYGAALIQALAPALILLIAAHWLLLFVYDVKPLILRVASMLIPLPFAFLLHSRHPSRLWPSAAAGFGMAFVAVFGMLVVTASLDKVPVLPQDARDTREVLEYVASIGLAFLTGLLLAEAFAWRRQVMGKPPRLVVLIAKALTPNDEGEFGIERAAKRVEKLVKAGTPVMTGAASVYAGVKALLDNLG